MNGAKERMDSLIARVQEGEMRVDRGWDEIGKLKDEYVRQLGQQSWNSYAGHRFQGLIHNLLKNYLAKLKSRSQEFEGLEILAESQIRRDSKVRKKLSVQFGDFLLLPDVDSALVWFDDKHSWNSEIIAVISCKTSLRERIAQSCYWKLKLLSSDDTRDIRVLLATTDNDDDFAIKKGGRRRYQGLHRNRVIAEHELDGVYILKGDFRADWESDKVKRFERIFDDMLRLAADRRPS